MTIFTARNEVRAKVIFLHLSVILFTGGSGTPPPRADPQCMLGYGQQVGGTHHAGMHSCCTYFLRCSSVKPYRFAYLLKKLGNLRLVLKGIVFKPKTIYMGTEYSSVSSGLTETQTD